MEIMLSNPAAPQLGAMREQLDTPALLLDLDRLYREGRIGWVVGISMVAPFAVVKLDQMEVFENGSRSEPDVEPHIFGLDGRKLNVEEHYREMVDDQGLAVLRKLSRKIICLSKTCPPYRNQR